MLEVLRNYCLKDSLYNKCITYPVPHVTKNGIMRIACSRKILTLLNYLFIIFTNIVFMVIELNINKK